MSVSTKKLAFTSFLDGFTMSGLFARKRWSGAPIIGFAPSAARHMPESEFAEIMRLVIRLRADSQRLHASAGTLESYDQVLQALNSETTASPSRRRQLIAKVLDLALTDVGASDIRMS